MDLFSQYLEVPNSDGESTEAPESIPLEISSQTQPENVPMEDLIPSQPTAEEKIQIINNNDDSEGTGWSSQALPDNKPTLASSTDSLNSSSEISRKYRCSICGLTGHSATNRKFHPPAGRTEEGELLEDVLPADVNFTLVTKTMLHNQTGKKSNNSIVPKLLKWAIGALGYAPRELAASMKVTGRFRMTVNTEEDLQMIADKEFEYEDIKFSWKPIREIYEFHKKRQELNNSLAKQNEGLEYDCRCQNNTPTMALARDPVDLRCASCNKMFHQKCLMIIIPESPLPGDWCYEFLCRKCNYLENGLLTESFSFLVKDWESILLVALYNMHLEAIKEKRAETEIFHENQIIDFIDKYFDALCYYKQKKNNVVKPMPTHLLEALGNAEIFKQGAVEGWGLVKYENPLLTHASPRKKKKPPVVTEDKSEDSTSRKRGEKRKRSEISSTPPKSPPPLASPSTVYPNVLPPKSNSPPPNTASKFSRPPLSMGNSFSGVATFPTRSSPPLNDKNGNNNGDNDVERLFTATKVIKKRRMNYQTQYLIQLHEEGRKEKIRVWFNSGQLSLLGDDAVVNPPPSPPQKVQTEDDLQEISAAKMIDGQLNFLVQWKGHDTHTFVPSSVLNKIAPMSVIKFYESRVSFDEPASKSNRRSDTHSNNNSINKDSPSPDEITTNLALQLVQQQKVQQQIISHLLQNRKPVNSTKHNNNNTSQTKFTPCGGCNVLLRYHADASQIQCPRCKTLLTLNEKSAVTAIDIEKE